MNDPLASFTSTQIAQAREDLAADMALYQSLFDQGMDAAQARQEMVKRGHGERYVGLLARHLASYTLEPVLDPHTGLAKWPLSFKRIERDFKRPNKAPTSTSTKPGNPKSEQPPTVA